MKNEKGIIALAVILSMLLVISALAVFGVVSGRFGLSYHLNNRIQALRDAETASFIAYQLIRDGDVAMPAPDDDPAPVITVNLSTGHSVGVTLDTLDANMVAIDTDDPADGVVDTVTRIPIKAKVAY